MIAGNVAILHCTSLNGRVHKCILPYPTVDVHDTYLGNGVKLESTVDSGNPSDLFEHTIMEI